MRVGGVDNEVSFVGHISGNHVERAVVVANGRRIDATPGTGGMKRQL